MKEPDFEAMMKGKKRFLPPRFMTVSQAAEQLLEIASAREDGGASLEPRRRHCVRACCPTSSHCTPDAQFAAQC